MVEAVSIAMGLVILCLSVMLLISLWEDRNMFWFTLLGMSFVIFICAFMAYTIN